MPERRPARRDPAVLGRAGGREVPDRIQPGRPQVRPVRVRPLDRVTQDRDHPGAGDQRADPPLRLPVVQVEGGRLAAQRAGRRGVEQRLVVLPPPDVLPVGLHVAGPAATLRRRAVGEEELGFLDRGHEQLGMPGQGRMQGGGARLGGTDRRGNLARPRGDLLSASEISYYPDQFNSLKSGRSTSLAGRSALAALAAARVPVHAASLPFRRMRTPPGAHFRDGVAAATTGTAATSRAAWRP